MNGTILVDQKRYDALKATHVTMSIEIADLKAEVPRLREALAEIEKRTRPRGDLADYGVNLIVDAALNPTETERVDPEAKPK